MDNLNVHDNVEAYVLGALDECDKTAFERHLDECPSCQREAASYVPVLSALRELPLPAVPPLRTRANNVIPIRTFLATAAAALLAVGGMGGSFVQRTQNSDMMAIAEMSATSAETVSLLGNGAEGHAIVGQGRQRTAFVVDGLPEAGTNRQYRVWIDNGASSPGILHRSGRGYELLIVRGDVLRGTRSITINLEASGGSPHMTGRPIVSATSLPV
jgi:anti-sigma-K factor RskA/putative zinc finger protein